jgi:hypothetical protein
VKFREKNRYFSISRSLAAHDWYMTTLNWNAAKFKVTYNLDIFRPIRWEKHIFCRIWIKGISWQEQINIIKISWISAFYSYLNLKYLPSAFRMKMLWFRVTISSCSCQLIPLIQIRQKMCFSPLIGRKISRLYVTLNLAAFQFKVVMYQSCAASERLIEK